MTDTPTTRLRKCLFGALEVLLFLIPASVLIAVIVFIAALLSAAPSGAPAGCAVVWTNSMPLDMARELIALAKAGRAT